MEKKDIVRLTEEERETLWGVIKKFKGSSEQVRRAYMLFKADVQGPHWTDKKIAAALSWRTQNQNRLGGGGGGPATDAVRGGGSSWLNIAENELSVMTRQWLHNRRFGAPQQLAGETAAWSTASSERQRAVDWQFKINDAHIELKSLYPKIRV